MNGAGFKNAFVSHWDGHWQHCLQLHPEARPSHTPMRALLPSLLLLLSSTPSAAARPPPLITSFSYTVSPSGPDFDAMWSADDFCTTDGNASRPWHSFLLATGNDTQFAALSSQILARTSQNVPVMWTWDGWLTTAGNATAMRTSWSAFAGRQRALRAAFPHLPSSPYGVFLGDEPGLLVVPARQRWLRAGLALVKGAFPEARTYLNMLFASVACDSSYAYKYCCCGTMDGAAGLATALGTMQLDMISHDEYYDVSPTDFRTTYETHLYPSLRPDQSVMLVPFAAYCELKCPANTSLVPAAEERVLGVAKEHARWYAEDPRVAGMAIYRLKNIWRANARTTDVCENPTGNGLGLVDRCGVGGTGDYATPRALAFYQNLSNAAAAAAAAAAAVA